MIKSSITLSPDNYISDYSDILKYSIGLFLPPVLSPSNNAVCFDNWVEKKSLTLKAHNPWQNTVLKLNKGIFFGGAYCIIDGNNNDLLAHPSIDTIFETYKTWHGYWDKLFLGKTAPLHHYTGKTLLLNGWWASEFFHFYCDVLGRVSIANEFFATNDYFDRIVISERALPYMLYWFDKLKITKKIVLSSHDVAYICDELYLPTLPHTTGYFTRNTIDFLNNLSKDIAPKKAENLFISRSISNNRRIANEKLLIEELQKIFNIEVLTLEKLTIEDQVGYFKGAKFILSSHGGGLTNLVFANNQVKILETFGRNYLNNCYARLSLLQGIDYKSFVSDDCVDFDYTVDIKLLLKILMEWQ